MTPPFPTRRSSDREQNPGHERKGEIEEGGDQRRPVARLPETLLHDIIQGVDEIAGMFTLARERGRIVECGPAVALGLRAAGPASGAGVPRTRIMRASTFPALANLPAMARWPPSPMEWAAQRAAVSRPNSPSAPSSTAITPSPIPSACPPPVRGR